MRFPLPWGGLPSVGFCAVAGLQRTREWSQTTKFEVGGCLWVDGNGRDFKGVQMDANQIYLIAVSIDNVRRVLVRYVSLFL